LHTGRKEELSKRQSGGLRGRGTCQKAFGLAFGRTKVNESGEQKKTRSQKGGPRENDEYERG